ncbi:MAG: single-stranded DNA-binding protein [Candidatus Saccharimonadales bacterium]
MARSFNQVILVGNLTRDPELKTVPSGQSVATFGMATNRVWTDQNGDQQEQADFHNVVAWAKLAELAEQYLSKGRRVMVVGRLHTRSWEDDDGKKNYRTEIVASEINFLDGPGGSEAADADATSSGSSTKKSSKKSKDVEIEDLDEEVDLSEIPF